MDTPEDHYRDCFRSAMGDPAMEPYPYQIELACRSAFPQLVDVPTGLGKNAAVALGWVFRRRFHPDDSIRRTTPRRLVYCLPMRVLVEQTRDYAVTWLDHLGQFAGTVEYVNAEKTRIRSYTVDLGKYPESVGVHVLMGGERADDWDLHPERDAILIGTQDMLLSRALNRGYGMSRYRWPMHFGLLNNDCLWVFDEVQLMDAGVATAAQLEAFRRNLGNSLCIHSLWMSATLEPNWLDTVDFDRSWLGEPIGLTDEDYAPVRERREATKPIQQATATMADSQAIAKAIVTAHSGAAPSTRTLAVFNTVGRAVEVYDEIRKRDPAARTLLIHSRFRPLERKEQVRELLAPPPPEGTIVITTQVVEAGVDVSARLLFTELAPWSSLVQRFGRCNRAGEFNKTKSARVSWFDLPDDEEDQQGLSPPYELNDLFHARTLLKSCRDAAPKSLKSIPANMRLEAPHVIRRRDLLDLFDTTPDPAGNDIDISRFIRSGEELDVQVFWRDVPKDAKAPDPQQENGRAPCREELCSVPVFGKQGFREFVKKKRGNIWRWDALERKWSATTPEDVYPGQTFLVRSDAGGYDSDIGWNSFSKSRVEPLAAGDPLEAYADDPASAAPWQTIAQHTDDVVKELATILMRLALDDDIQQLLLDAARWHDRGKAHPGFVAKLKPDALADAPLPSQHGWYPGKAPKDAWRSWQELQKLSRQPEQGDIHPHFRHELASALAMLQMGMDDLTVYLVGAHHGKVRLSIRSLPGEKTPDGDPSRLYARGVWDGDELPQVDLGGGVTAPEVTLSLQCMQLGRSDDGQPSWAERMLKLRDNKGPFRLAYLEALLRAADMRASRLAAERLVEQQEATS